MVVSRLVALRNDASSPEELDHELNIWSTTSFTWFSILTNQSHAVILKCTELLSVQISESRGSRIWDQARSSPVSSSQGQSPIYTTTITCQLLLPILCRGLTNTGSSPPRPCPSLLPFQSNCAVICDVIRTIAGEEPEAPL